MIDILTEIREKISCPQFGDNHYGEWGALPLSQRATIKRLLDYSVGQEEVVNRQKAEIERLKNSGIRANSVDDWLKHCNELRAEAIKKFAKRLKAEMLKSKYIITSSPYSRACNAVIDFWADEIDNLVKEMVGDGNESTA